MKQAQAKSADAPKGLAILDKAEVEQQALPEDEPLPESSLVSGSGKNWLGAHFDGEFTLMLWEAEQAKLRVDSPHPYDQYVEVLKGELILTDAEGSSATFEKGDRFVLRKGFTGTWQMTEDYRELLIVGTEQLNAAEQPADDCKEAGE